MTKRILSLLLSLVMVMSLAVTASAYVYTGDYWTFNDVTGVLTLNATGTLLHTQHQTYGKQATSIVFEGTGLTGIGNYAFENFGNLTEITIPDTVTTIGLSAFENCTKLSKVTLPSGLTSIGEEAFSFCALTSINIPSSVTTIAPYAFSYNVLTSVKLPMSLTYISDGCFRSNKFTTIDIPETVTTLGNQSFGYCYQLENITIPASVTSIADYCFRNCTALKEVYFEGNAPEMSTLAFDGVTSVTFYYPKGDSTWTQAYRDGFGSKVTWKAYSPEGQEITPPTIKASNNLTSGKPKLTWAAVEGAEKYQVYRSTSKNSGYKLMKTVTGTSYTNTNAVVGKKYYYKVRAIDEYGEKSLYSNIVSRTCDLPRPDVKIANVLKTGKIKLTWDAVEGAVKYEVYRSTSQDGTYSLMKTVLEGTSYINTSAKAGTKYYYKVKAIHSNSAANSAYSVVDSRVCDLARPVTSISLASTGKPKISWSKVDGAIKYKVYRSTKLTGTYSLMKTVSGTTYTNANAKAGTTYYYKVIAVHSNSAANSAYSTAKYIKSK